MIYLNPAGLSPFKTEVQQEISRTLDTFSHLLYAESGIQLYRETLQRCRKTIADWLALNDEDRLAFVPNATTACCLVLSRIHWKPGDILLTTIHENSTILYEIEQLAARGVKIISLDPDTGTGLLPTVEHALHEYPVRAIVISHVSHLDGRIFPIDTLQDMARTHQALLIVDGAQAVGHIPVSFQEMCPDAYFFPGHKWCAGPMGTGVLVLGKEFGSMSGSQRSTPGDQQHKQPTWMSFELGTHNIGLIAGLAKACDMKGQEKRPGQFLEEIRKEWKACLTRYPGVRIVEWNGPHAPGILTFACLDENTAHVMQATACTHYLAWKTFAHPTHPSRPSIRVSWTTDTPKDDIRFALECLTPT
jgi:selenocysteine lyase/cysteine desulfurase